MKTFRITAVDEKTYNKKAFTINSPKDSITKADCRAFLEAYDYFYGTDMVLLEAKYIEPVEEVIFPET